MKYLYVILYVETGQPVVSVIEPCPVSTRKLKYMKTRTPLIFLTIGAFIITSIGPLPVQAQLALPTPGVRVGLSPPENPPVLKGVTVDPRNPFHFDFVLDQGDSTSGKAQLLSAKAGSGVKTDYLKQEARRLIKYFLASITTPEQDLWVNLSPYEKNRIIPKSFGQTDMGRDLLAEDYILKQITASLIYPEDEFGKKFWKRVYEEAAKKYGIANIPVNTFNKVWIVPDHAKVYEHGNGSTGSPRVTAFVVKAKLKVMLEEDYLAMSKHAVNGEWSMVNGQKQNTTINNSPSTINQLGSQIVRELVIPALETEVNEGKNFSTLRQVYYSLILAVWFKKRMKDSILGRKYMDQNKVEGIHYENSVVPESTKLSSPNVSIGDPGMQVLGSRLKQSGTTKKDDVEAIYHRYLAAFKKGVYNYIKEEPDPVTQQVIPRKYFSGGFSVPGDFAMHSIDYAQTIQPDEAMTTGDAAKVTVNLASAQVSNPAASDQAMNVLEGKVRLRNGNVVSKELAERVVNILEHIWSEQDFNTVVINVMAGEVDPKDRKLLQNLGIPLDDYGGIPGDVRQVIESSVFSGYGRYGYYKYIYPIQPQVSVVKIKFLFKDHESQGTGFIVGEDEENFYVLTNEHVVQSSYVERVLRSFGKGGKYVEVYFNNAKMFSSWQVVPGTVIAANKKGDIALIKISRKQTERFDPIVANFSFRKKTINGGYIFGFDSKLNTINRESIGTLQTAQLGFSGSPVIAENGIVGMFTGERRILEVQGGVRISDIFEPVEISAERIREFLLAYKVPGIKFEHETEDTAQVSPTSPDQAMKAINRRNFITALAAAAIGTRVLTPEALMAQTAKNNKRNVVIRGYIHSNPVDIGSIIRSLMHDYPKDTEADIEAYKENAVDKILKMYEEIIQSYREDVIAIRDAVQGPSQAKTIAVELSSEEVKAEQKEGKRILQDIKAAMKRKGVDAKKIDDMLLYLLGPVYYLWESDSEWAQRNKLKIVGVDDWDLKKKTFVILNDMLDKSQGLDALVKDENLKREIKKTLDKMIVDPLADHSAQEERLQQLTKDDEVLNEHVKNLIELSKSFNKLADERSRRMANRAQAIKGNVLIIMGQSHFDRVREFLEKNKTNNVKPLPKNNWEERLEKLKEDVEKEASLEQSIQREKDLASYTPFGVDAAMVEKEQKQSFGGIDLTANRMKVDVDSDKAAISQPMDLKALENIEINGLYIKDIEIKPLNNLPQSLGISGE